MKTFLFSSLLLFTVLIFASFGGDENSDYPSGAPAGYTGSPGDAHNCTSCHNGSASNVNGWITSTIPVDGYTPGNSYTITVTLTGSGQKGFEVSPQNVSGTLLGTLTAGTNNHLTGSGKYVTQNAKTSANPATWSFTWTAPAAGTGSVTFYGAFCVSKPVTKLSTLVVGEYIPPVPLAVTATATPSVICNGESSQLNAMASGGSGSYTYSWTSIPVGYTSNIPNPLVQPTQNTKYIVLVNDGSNSLADTADVTVNQPPTAFAGNDTTYNINVTQIELQGVATDYASLLWTTSGDGTFNNSGALTATYLPGAGDKATGSVNLTLTATPIAPCSGNASSVIHILLEVGAGLNNQNQELSIVVSPNPTNGVFYITTKGMDKDVNLVFYNCSGQILRSEMLNLSSGIQKMINISAFSKGIYFLKLRSDSGTTTRKIILE